MKLVIPLIFICQCLSAATLIQPERNWTYVPNVTVGRFGGIPTYKTNLINAVTTYGASTNGITETSHEIILAIDASAATSNSIAYLPAGRYRVAHEMLLTKNTSITGDGTNTVLLLEDYGFFKSYGGYLYNELITPINSGYTNGSSNIVLSASIDPSTYVGGVARIYQNNAAGVFITAGWENLQGQYVTITGISGTDVSFWPPLCWTLSNSLSPKIVTWKNNSYVTNIGIQNLMIDASSSAQIPILWSYIKDGWIKNVTIKHFSSYAIMLQDGSLNCELRENWISDPISSGPNHGGVVFYNTSSALVEDNIFDRVFPSVEGSGKFSASAILYNLCINSDDGFNIGASIMPAHNVHTHKILIEGNKASVVQFDNNDGNGALSKSWSSSDCILYRNWFTGTNAYVSPRKRGIHYGAHSFNQTAIANIVGAPGVSWIYSTSGTGDGNDNLAYCYSFGYPYIGNWGWYPYDANVLATADLQWNYDFATPGIPTAQQTAVTLPKSLAYNAQPNWWNTNCVWPAYGPSVDNITNMIPAEYRYYGYTNINGGGGTTNPPIVLNTNAHGTIKGYFNFKGVIR